MRPGADQEAGADQAPLRRSIAPMAPWRRSGADQEAGADQAPINIAPALGKGE